MILLLLISALSISPVSFTQHFQTHDGGKESYAPGYYPLKRELTPGLVWHPQLILKYETERWNYVGGYISDSEAKHSGLLMGGPHYRGFSFLLGLLLREIHYWPSSYSLKFGPVAERFYERRRVNQFELLPVYGISYNLTLFSKLEMTAFLNHTLVNVSLGVRL